MPYNEKDLDIFKRITVALFELESDADKERILRAAALLVGMEFVEEKRRRNHD